MYFNINTCEGSQWRGESVKSLAALFCSNNFYKHSYIFSAIAKRMFK